MTRSSRPVWLGEDSRGWDHARVHKQLLTDSRLDAAQTQERRGPNRSHVLAVYLGLAIHAETQTGDTRPAQSTLARYAGCSVKTVARCLDVLVDAGYLAIEERPGMASVYRMLPPPTPDLRTDVQRADPGPSVVPSPDLGSGTPDPGTDEQEVEREPVDENSLVASDEKDREDPARTLVRGFWTWCEENGRPRPTLRAVGGRGPDRAFLSLVGIVRTLLDAGHPPAAVKRALTRTKAYTIDALTFELGNDRAPGAGPRADVQDKWAGATSGGMDL